MLTHNNTQNRAHKKRNFFLFSEHKQITHRNDDDDALALTHFIFVAAFVAGKCTYFSQIPDSKTTMLPQNQAEFISIVLFTELKCNLFIFIFFFFSLSFLFAMSVFSHKKEKEEKNEERDISDLV